ELRVSPFHLCFQSRIGHFASAEHLDLALLQAKVGRSAVRVKLVAIRKDAPVVVAQKLFWIGRYLPGWQAIPAGPVLGPLQTPVQRTDYAVVVHRRKPGLPSVHPLLIAFVHVFLRITNGSQKGQRERSQRRNWRVKRQSSGMERSPSARQNRKCTPSRPSPRLPWNGALESMPCYSF